mmetsp:Transcript_146965/g.259076  ORF Transcript_146965/g.259076 Transcript_146965/m.259076 type:complete len:233 (+) Transcript_146965:373-1071(+)
MEAMEQRLDVMPLCHPPLLSLKIGHLRSPGQLLLCQRQRGTQLVVSKYYSILLCVLGCNIMLELTGACCHHGDDILGFFQCCIFVGEVPCKLGIAMTHFVEGILDFRQLCVHACDVLLGSIQLGLFHGKITRQHANSVHRQTYAMGIFLLTTCQVMFANFQLALVANQMPHGSKQDKDDHQGKKHKVLQEVQGSFILQEQFVNVVAMHECLHLFIFAQALWTLMDELALVCI